MTVPVVVPEPEDYPGQQRLLSGQLRVRTTETKQILRLGKTTLLENDIVEIKDDCVMEINK